MSAECDLTNAYQEWRRLAEAEGEAIGECNWGLVSACQTALKQLQERITRLSAAARKEWSKSGDRTVKEKILNTTIHELIHIERRNQTLLEAIKETARAKIAQVNLAGQNLKQIQRSYGSVHPPADTAFSLSDRRHLA